MENNNEAPKVYRVPEANLAVLESRIAKLAKRAAKLKVPAPALTVIGTEEVKSVRDGVTRIRRIASVTVSGDAPKIAGWAFAAVLQPVVTEDGSKLGNLLRIVP